VFIFESAKCNQYFTGSWAQTQCRTVMVFNVTMRNVVNTLRTGDADLRLYITTVQDG
jgi:hypothetical protein